MSQRNPSYESHTGVGSSNKPSNVQHTTSSPSAGAGNVSPPSKHNAPNFGHDENSPKSRVTDSAQHKASELRDDLQSKASEATAAVKHKAAVATDQAKASGRKYAAEKMSKLSEEVGVFSSAIRKASGKLREEEHDSIASYIDAAAEHLDHIRDSLESKSVSQVMDDLQDLSRRRPEIVYGGLFVAGLAAMRFLKASKPKRSNNTQRSELRNDLYGGSRRQATGSEHRDAYPTSSVYAAPAAIRPLASTGSHYGDTNGGQYSPGTGASTTAPPSDALSGIASSEMSSPKAESAKRSSGNDLGSHPSSKQSGVSQ